MTLIEAFCACSGRSLCHAIIASFSVGKSVETAPLCSVAGRLASLATWSGLFARPHTLQSLAARGIGLARGARSSIHYLKCGICNTATMRCPEFATPFGILPFRRNWAGGHKRMLRAITILIEIFSSNGRTRTDAMNLSCPGVGLYGRTDTPPSKGVSASKSRPSSLNDLSSPGQLLHCSCSGASVQTSSSQALSAGSSLTKRQAG